MTMTFDAARGADGKLQHVTISEQRGKRKQLVVLNRDDVLNLFSLLRYDLTIRDVNVELN